LFNYYEIRSFGSDKDDKLNDDKLNNDLMESINIKNLPIFEKVLQKKVKNESIYKYVPINDNNPYNQNLTDIIINNFKQLRDNLNYPFELMFYIKCDLPKDSIGLLYVKNVLKIQDKNNKDKVFVLNDLGLLIELINIINDYINTFSEPNKDNFILLNDLTTYVNKKLKDTNLTYSISNRRLNEFLPFLFIGKEVAFILLKIELNKVFVLESKQLKNLQKNLKSYLLLVDKIFCYKKPIKTIRII